MEKNRFIKTALCLVLAFAMTFVPIFSSYAMIATALVVNEGEVTEEAAPADNVDEAGGDEAAPEEDSAPAEETAEVSTSVKIPASCFKDGTTTYTATFSNRYFRTQKKESM